MKRFIRLYNNRIIDTKPVMKNYYDLQEEKYYLIDCGIVLHKHFREYGQNGCLISEPVFTNLGLLKKESDNITDLLEEGDLIKCGKKSISEYKFPVNDKITKIWTKDNNNNYILQWEQN